MARPDLNLEQRNARKAAALQLLKTGLLASEVARRINCSKGAITQWVAEENAALDAEVAALGAAIAELTEDEHSLPAWATDDLRVRVFGRLSAGSASQMSSGRCAAWTTPALRFAFGDSFCFAEDKTPVPDDVFVRVVESWGCAMDELGRWRPPQGG